MTLNDLDLDALWTAGQAAVVAEDDARIEHFLGELHGRGTRETFERALASCESSEENERVFGVRILRQLGGTPPTFAAEAMEFLIGMLGRETSPMALPWIISAIGKQCSGVSRPLGVEGKRRALLAVLARASHETVAVRYAVASTLSRLINVETPEDDAVGVLLALAADPEEDTRYYALSALVDDLGLALRPEVHTMLEQRLNDSDPEIKRCARRALDGGSWAD